ncbi:hypothetical protein DFH28DRAFT_1137164 [Melampsora americana]|nr:hypothetical protein DFH28DRAFT_1137164 [Melampsora americana]
MFNLKLILTLSTATKEQASNSNSDNNKPTKDFTEHFIFKVSTANSEPLSAWSGFTRSTGSQSATSVLPEMEHQALSILPHVESPQTSPKNVFIV